MSGTLLGLMAATLVIATGVSWYRRMQQVRVPEDRRLFLGAMGVGAALGVLALFQGPGLLGGVAAAVAALGGGVFLGLRLQSGQDARVPAVKVGEVIPDFTAPDDAGEAFALASLRGRPFLLKFFRGHW